MRILTVFTAISIAVPYSFLPGTLAPRQARIGDAQGMASTVSVTRPPGQVPVHAPAPAPAPVPAPVLRSASPTTAPSDASTESHTLNHLHFGSVQVDLKLEEVSVSPIPSDSEGLPHIDPPFRYFERELDNSFRYDSPIAMRSGCLPHRTVVLRVGVCLLYRLHDK